MFDWPAELSTPLLEQKLFNDADAIGVPRQTVVLMLRLFVACTRINRHSNKSGIRHLEEKHGMRVLALKLSTDRDTVINAVLPSEDIAFRQKMVQINRAEISQYFTRLSSSSDYQLTKMGRSCDGLARHKRLQLKESLQAWFDYARMAYLQSEFLRHPPSLLPVFAGRTSPGALRR